MNHARSQPYVSRAALRRAPLNPPLARVNASRSVAALREPSGAPSRPPEPPRLACVNQVARRLSLPTRGPANEMRLRSDVAIPDDAGVAQLAEAADLKSAQSGFESQHQHQPGPVSR